MYTQFNDLKTRIICKKKNFKKNENLIRIEYERLRGLFSVFVLIAINYSIRPPSLGPAVLLIIHTFRTRSLIQIIFSCKWHVNIKMLETIDLYFNGECFRRIFVLLLLGIVVEKGFLYSKTINRRNV